MELNAERTNSRSGFLFFKNPNPLGFSRSQLLQMFYYFITLESWLRVYFTIDLARVVDGLLFEELGIVGEQHTNDQHDDLVDRVCEIDESSNLRCTVPAIIDDRLDFFFLSHFKRGELKGDNIAVGGRWIRASVCLGTI